MTPERILVTGAGGFLGSHICTYLGRKGHSITAIDRLSLPSGPDDLYPNLRSSYTMELPDPTFPTLIKEFRPSLLVHCAGSASVPYSMQEPLEDFRQSAAVTAFILDTLRKDMPSCRFIFLSSAAIYGNPQKLPVGEEAPCRPISPYGYHKWLCEMLCQEYESIFHIKSSILRIFSAYGERLRKQVLFDLCRKFADPSGAMVKVYGTGNETRDFIHANDIAQAIDRIYTAGASGVFNVASGTQTTIRDIAEMIKHELRSNKEIIYNGHSRQGDPLYWQADISKLSSLGFQQKIELAEGVRNYCRWFESIYRRKDDQ